jgi:hypothetical protein
MLDSNRASQLRRGDVVPLLERQTNALESIASRLSGIEAKLDRVARALERDANPATHPF